jgi:polyisoprenyl-phosphate glycosyltransferase
VKKISIMTPCYNEEMNIEQCYLKVREVMTTHLHRYSYEHLFIDNCSTDRTIAILKDIAARDRNVKIIVNSRNFGPHRSPYYGILQTSGDAVIPFVADLQMPPQKIVDLVDKWEAGYKMVVAVRTGMKENIVLRAARGLFYRVMSRLSHIEQIGHFIGFGLFDRQIVDILRAMDDPCPYFRGMVSEIGFEKAFIEYQQPPRKHGKSKNSLIDLFEYAFVGISSYSKAPLRIATFLGFITSLVSLLVAIVYLILKLLYWDAFPMGTAPIIIGLFFFASTQLLCIGFLGEYIGLIYEHVKKRPLVIEKERVNFE